MQVALVVMPFAAADRPSLGAGLLQAALRQRGIACDTKYFNATLCRLMGSRDYHFFAREVSVAALAGEWAFSQLYWGEQASSWESYQREVLDEPRWGMREVDRPRLLALRNMVPLFLQMALGSNDWGAYDLIGFTSTFEQTMPGLCLARMIRERFPHVKLAFGGANFEAGMGRAYIERFPFIDYVSTGEADRSFPALCERLRDGDPRVPGGFYHRAGGVVAEAPRERGTSPESLDELPVPDFEDYFRVRAATLEGEPVTAWLPVEASRGCWWGEIAHCTFCGLNGETMAFRKKSPERVIAEVDELGRRHGPLPLQFADNILSMDYFKSLLPLWAERGRGPDKFFEIKSNLKRDHVRLLRDAGVTVVQAGVETLSDTTLRVMKKGVSAAQNVAVLRWCTEYGVEGLWNLIYGFPGEDPADDARMLALLHKLVHLAPPSVVAPIRMDRFSPNFERHREHGFTRVEPMPSYRHVFPFPDETLRQLAYYFHFEHPRSAEDRSRGRELAFFCKDWEAARAEGRNGVLRIERRGAGHALVDTRFTRRPTTGPVTREEMVLLLAADAPVTRASALARAGRATGAPEPALRRALDALLAEDILAEVGSHLVTLALLPLDRPDVAPAGVSLNVLGG